jgi:hypothetical protein
MKLPDGLPLTNSVGPTFENKKKTILSKFKTGNEDQFTIAKEMIDHFSNSYTNLFKVRNAKLDYRRLGIKKDPPLTKFYTNLLQLAGVANVPTTDYIDDLTDKDRSKSLGGLASVATKDYKEHSFWS